MNHFVFCVALLFVFHLTASAQKKEYNCLTLQTESEVQVSGSANVGGFRCHTDPREPEHLIPSCFIRSDDTIKISEVQFEIPVDGFSCGNPLVVKDLKEVLESKVYPNIKFDLHHLEAKQIQDNFFKGRVIATTEVKGVKKDVSFDAEVDELNPNYFMISGRIPIFLSWYGIAQPSRLFGLLKLEDQIDVCFELYFTKN
ncbi:MAG: YceI family protein [Salibacteraceae bacterium]